MAATRTGYGQYCPISRALDVLGERWSLLVVRDLLVGTTRFNDLSRGLPGLSRTLLTKRLRQLESAGIVERLDGEYLLTDAGQELRPIVFGLGDWGAKWTFGPPDPEELDPELLAWWMHAGIDASHLPDRRTVLHLRLTDHPQPFWFVVEPGLDPSVCLRDPGYDVDVTITSDLASLYEIWLGRLAVPRALKTGALTFDGPSALTRRMPSVLRLSVMAETVASHS